MSGQGNSELGNKKPEQGSSMIATEARRKLIEDAVIRSIARRKAKRIMEITVPVVEAKGFKFFSSKEDYRTMRHAWSAISSGASKEQHMFYNLLRGLDARRGFSEVKNEVKLANGAAHWYSAMMSNHFLKHQLGAWLMEPDRKFWNGVGKDLSKAYLAAFGPTVTPEVASEALKLLE